jgi:hypothetical protein
LLSADLGPGVLQVAGVWASDPNAYWNASEWTVAASYAFKATDKLKITPGVQYWDSLRSGSEFNNDLDKWRAGVTLDYAITEGLATRGLRPTATTFRASSACSATSNPILSMKRPATSVEVAGFAISGEYFSRLNRR